MKKSNPPQLLASWSWFNSFTYGINYLQQSPSKTYDHSCIYSIHIDTNPTNPRRLTLPFNDLCIRDISKQHSQDLYLECEHTLKYRSCFRFLSNLLLFQRIFRCHVIVPPKSNGMWTGLLSSQNKATGWPQKTLFLRFFPALTFLGGRGGKQLVVKPTHLKNMLVKLDDFSRDRDENKKIFELPPPRSEAFFFLRITACWKPFFFLACDGIHIVTSFDSFLLRGIQWSNGGRLAA